MSLTSHLADRASPIHQFFAELVPLAASCTAARELLGGVLYACKVSYQTSPVERKHLLQLLGYLLLDSDDALGITHVGLLLPRHCALVGVNVPRFLRLLGIAEDLPALRARFAAVVTALPPRIRRVQG